MNNGQFESNHLDRRQLTKAAIAAGCLAQPILGSNDTDTIQSIAPIQSWDYKTDTYSPFFPIGWYSFGPWARMQELHDNGANCALYAGLGREDWQVADAKGQMDIAARLGMKVVLGFDGTVAGIVKKDDPTTHAIIKKYVRAFNHHPALLGWQIGDEFSVGAAPAINATSELLTDLGSKHQTWQVHPHTWSNSDVRTLMAMTDVCTYDGYTYLDGMEEFATVASARVLAWQQAKTDLISSNGWAGNVNVTQAVGCKCGDLLFRFPTSREYRWNVFSAIATTAARGTMNWIYSYFGGFYQGEEDRFFEFRDKVVKPVNLEQRRLTHALTHGYDVGHVISNYDTPTSTAIPPATGPYRKFNQIGHILLHDSNVGSYFLIATNNEASPKDLRLDISRLPKRLKSLSVTDRYRNRALLLERQKRGKYILNDTLIGHDVAIYEFR